MILLRGAGPFCVLSQTNTTFTAQRWIPSIPFGQSVDVASTADSLPLGMPWFSDSPIAEGVIA